MYWMNGESQKENSKQLEELKEKKARTESEVGAGDLYEVRRGIWHKNT